MNMRSIYYKGMRGKLH